MEVPLHHRTVFFRGGAQVTVYRPLTSVSDIRGWQGDCAALPLSRCEPRAMPIYTQDEQLLCC